MTTTARRRPAGVGPLLDELLYQAAHRLPRHLSGPLAGAGVDGETSPDQPVGDGFRTGHLHPRQFLGRHLPRCASTEPKVRGQRAGRARTDVPDGQPPSRPAPVAGPYQLGGWSAAVDRVGPQAPFLFEKNPPAAQPLLGRRRRGHLRPRSPRTRAARVGRLLTRGPRCPARRGPARREQPLAQLGRARTGRWGSGCRRRPLRPGPARCRSSGHRVGITNARSLPSR